MTRVAEIERDVLHGHLFCGVGAGAKGFNRGAARVGITRARSVCVGGIDVDAAACRDFEKIAGVKASCMDLFTIEQYVAFHGKAPPAGWREAMPSDISKAFGGRRPHIVFLSAPCKGFSGLLSETASKLDKYQALNGLTLRGLWLLLEEFRDDPVELIVFENVPRIATRGRPLLDQIIALLRSYGYAVAESTHDCGELGGLGQSRKRFLLVARHQEKVPAFLYEPPKHRLRGVGEVLEKLPMPLSGLGGAMHRMPALQWQTWVRLAFVRAGADWRSLNDLAVEEGHLRDYGIVPSREWFRGAYGVTAWDEPGPTVTSNGRPASGAFSVADPREIRQADFHGLRVNKWGQTAAAITTQRSPGSSAQSVADPRVDGHPRSVQLGVRPWNKPAGVVTGQMAAGQGPNAVADPRLAGPRFNHAYRIVQWEQPSPGISSARGALAAVSDPRFANWHPGASSSKLRVTPWDGTARPVTGSQQVASGAGAVADPRFEGMERSPMMGVKEWTEPANLIAGQSYPSNGSYAVADPRAPDGGHGGKYRVTKMDEPAGTVIAASTTGNGAFAVADVRFKKGLKDFQTGGHYGVLRWNQTSRSVFAHGTYDNGFNSVADPRDDAAIFAPSNEDEKSDMGKTRPPADEENPHENNADAAGVDESWVDLGNSPLPLRAERLICVILALDGTWHRPFTTLELAALQGLVDPEEQFELDGLSDSAWRERIGNCVPPPSAQAIANMMFETLLLSWSGTTFTLSNTPIWVRNLAVGLSVKPQELPSW